MSQDHKLHRRRKNAIRRYEKNGQNKKVGEGEKSKNLNSDRDLLGTPDYLAPELLLGFGNGCEVDWWSLGVCLFEFLFGYPPFTDQSPTLIFKNILDHKIQWPEEASSISLEAKDLIYHLLDANPNTRYKEDEIKAHPFFNGLDWANIRNLPAPFLPSPNNCLDTSYFDDRAIENEENCNMNSSREFISLNDNESSSKKSDLKRENSTLNYYCDPVLNDQSNGGLEFDNFVYKNFNSLDDTNRTIANSPLPQQ